MTKKKGGTIAKVIAGIVALAVLILAVGLIYRFTNGFNEDFKTFYVEHDGEPILTTESSMDFARGEEYRFNVKYTFDVASSTTRDYFVSIVAHSSKDDVFYYTADGEKKVYKDGIDLTPAFELVKEDAFFTLKIPKEASIKTVLQSLHEGKTVEVDEEIEGKQPYLYTLVVSSYNKAVKYQIHFSIYFNGKPQEVQVEEHIIF